ncbi:MAG TPA: BamA/TamA family outer membrane protein [Bacteroidota bacterium]|nr:BamA/TamA family outer membrane protein [Bacteroidota bacterium]
MTGIRAVVVLTCILAAESYGQGMVTDYEVASLRFAGNAGLRSDDLLGVVQTKVSPSWFWKFLYKVSEAVGQKPEYYNPTQFGEDALRLKMYYISNGFRAATVDTSVAVDDEEKQVALTFRISEGRRSYIDTLRYGGLLNLPNDLRSEILDHKLIAVGDPFVEQKVVDERQRILSAFANYGYVQVRLDTLLSVQYASTNNIAILFAFSPGQRYKFGRIRIETDSTVSQRIEPDVVRRFLDFTEGDYFNLAAKTQSEINLNRLGVFESAQIVEMVNDSTKKNLEIPMGVFVRPRPFYELSPEVGVNDERGYPNVSLALGYVDRSFFGGARNLNSRLRLNVHSFQDLDLVKAFRKDGLRDSTILTNADMTVNFVQPYFFNNKTSLTMTLFAALEKQRTYYSPILRFRIGAAAQTATYTRAFIDWNLEGIHPQSTATGLDTVFTGSAQAELRAQFNSILTFTLQRDLRNDFFSATQGFFHSITLEEAGILPSAFNGLFGLGLPYARYVKATALGQWYWDPAQSRAVIWAAKLHAGAAQLYGHSPAEVPLTRRFYAGGSGSVRGWGARQLGMIAQPDTGGSALLEGSLEARWNPLRNADDIWFFETRKLSFVLFYDAGNLWPEAKKIRFSEIAMATGIGLRYETVAGPIRVDFGWKVYDPKGTPGSQWITSKPFFSKVLPDFVFHLGVGQAF